MKKITINTRLLLSNTFYSAVEIGGTIYWVGPISNLDELCTNGVDIFIPSSIEGYSLEYAQMHWQKIFAQSELVNEGIPVISLDNWPDEWAKEIAANEGYCSNESWPFRKGFEKAYSVSPNKYTDKDIEKAISLSRGAKNAFLVPYTIEEIFEKINKVSTIEIDEKFNIIQYD